MTSAKVYTATIPRIDSDRIYEGLRIPPSLDNTTSVNFVLTQEPGKLKPKDLKIAIEKNRAERELRAIEQKKIRDEGGGAGLLDLRGILSEERLNLIDGDPFKRQLRELAFLQDVDDVQKLEIEKGFRISENYLGSEFLSQDEIQTIYKQRADALLLKRKAEWRSIQSRQQTELYNPMHPLVKAGASIAVTNRVLSTITPLFDPNSNDIWGKRLNTLRRFISLVSRWLIRRRVKERVRKVRQTFEDHGAHTREEVLAFIDEENLAYRKSGGKNVLSKTHASAAGGSKGAVAKAAEEPQPVAAPASVASMVFSQPSDMQVSREFNEAVLARNTAGEVADLVPQMVRRVLFPKCSPHDSGGGNRKEIPPPDLRKGLLQFNDKTFFQLKTRPEFSLLGYSSASPPAVPVFFPPCADKTLRVGAPEERFLRSAADPKVSIQDLNKAIHEADGIVDTTPQLVKDMHTIPTVAPADHEPPPPESLPELADAAPAWLQAEAEWQPRDRDFFRRLPQYRMLIPPPRRCEMDPDWALRPNLSVQKLVYQPDSSLRTQWLGRPGFSSANMYLLGGQESRNRDPFPAAAGPTITSLYSPDSDRHTSGLCCYSEDHLRGLAERDADVGPLQSKQDKQDCLTDSESDNEDAYAAGGRPDMQKVRKLLSAPLVAPPPVKEDAAPAAAGGKAGKAPPAKGAKPAAAPPVAVKVEVPPAASSAEEEAFSPLKDSQRRDEQVELMRDRKALELESTFWNERKKRENDVADKMTNIASKSQCAVLAMPVQLPFHRYEEEVYALMESKMPPPSSAFVEPDPRQHMSLSSLSIAESPAAKEALPPFSPLNYKAN
mmetsp:Transcript_14133/g.19328  ORF Transcript_14133/g.19328 Transcript_14133/m.19328 type:complete len:834 (-) Transcript_14133:1368-3869(-)